MFENTEKLKSMEKILGLKWNDGFSGTYNYLEDINNGHSYDIHRLQRTVYLLLEYLKLEYRPDMGDCISKKPNRGK